MRKIVLTLVAGLLIAAVPALGQQSSGYKLELLEQPRTDTVEQGGKNVRLVTIRFAITRQGEDADLAGKDYKIIIEEDGKEAKRIDVPKAKPSEDMSVIFALDVSGSMREGGRMKQAKNAASYFFQKLPAKADAGLILFDHEMAVTEPLTLDRGPLLAHIQSAEPRGGTAYLDAIAKGVDMVGHVQGKQKAVVVLTDGIDLNSKTTLPEAVARAKSNGVKVYTIGIGEPGRQDKITSVLVLDRSFSMLSPANDDEKVTKLQALKTAASRFLIFVKETPQGVEGNVRSTVLDFGDTPNAPGPFTNNRVALTNAIQKLEGLGETCLFDATYEGIVALEAERPRGKKVIVALTDGIDNASRRRVDEVIDRAKEAKVPLYMLGFGRDKEIDPKVMQMMAEQTGGSYHHARDQKSLLQIFEKLSVQIHDDGIDETSLKELAAGTGGQYYPAKDVSKLQFILEQVSKAIQRKEYTETFPSLVQIDDGRRRPVRLRLLSSTGEEEGGTEEVTYGVRGLVLPQANHFVYLGMLGLLAALLGLPAGLRRFMKPSS